MQLIVTDDIPTELLNDKKFAEILNIFDLISSKNLSCGKVPVPEGVDSCRDVLDVVLDALESSETSDNVLTQLEQLRFLLSQPHFQVCLGFIIYLFSYFTIRLNLEQAVFYVHCSCI